jgi:hypothetical protein
MVSVGQGSVPVHSADVRLTPGTCATHRAAVFKHTYIHTYSECITHRIIIFYESFPLPCVRIAVGVATIAAPPAATQSDATVNAAKVLVPIHRDIHTRRGTLQKDLISHFLKQC